MLLKILIADDHVLLRQGLRQLLGDENPDYEFVEADGFNTALEVLAQGEADLCLIDLGMPDMCGAESLRQLRAAHPETKIAVLTGSVAPTLAEVGSVQALRPPDLAAEPAAAGELPGGDIPRFTSRQRVSSGSWRRADRPKRSPGHWTWVREP